MDIKKEFKKILKKSKIKYIEYESEYLRYSDNYYRYLIKYNNFLFIIQYTLKNGGCYEGIIYEGKEKDINKIYKFYDSYFSFLFPFMKILIMLYLNSKTKKITIMSEDLNYLFFHTARKEFKRRKKLNEKIKSKQAINKDIKNLKRIFKKIIKEGDKNET